jgi:hypothetical protein
MRAIKEKQLENQYNIRQKETQKSIEVLKEKAKMEIVNRRRDLEKLIKKMREKEKRKTNSLNIKLQTVRNTMAQEMGKAYKKGTIQNCVEIGNGTEDGVGGSIQKVEKRKHYCIANFSDNYAMYQNCLETDDFCHVCCDTEFGEFFNDDRESCYSKSCNSDAPNKEEKVVEKSASGKWIWQNTD